MHYYVKWGGQLITDEEVCLEAVRMHLIAVTAVGDRHRAISHNYFALRAE
jgi:hypothetical protein